MRDEIDDGKSDIGTDDRAKAGSCKRDRPALACPLSELPLLPLSL